MTRSEHDRTAARAALTAGLAYLKSVQADSGEFPVFSAHSPDMTVRRVLDPCLFGTAAIAGLLGDCSAAAALCERACDFIEGQCDRGDVWMYFKLGHPPSSSPPPDVDDSALAAFALAGCGRRVPAHRSILLGNRDEYGMFYTWIMPRFPSVNWSLLKANWRHLFWNSTYRAFFRGTLCEIEDIDAGINANVLAGLGRFDGDQRVVDYLLQILREGREDSCDKYYDDPVLIRYFFSRALVGRCAEAGQILVDRAHAGPEASPLHLALTILIRSIWGAPIPDDLVARLIAAQGESGEWPIAALYCAGRPQTGYCRFGPTAEDRYRAGSEAMTTAFCVAALDAVAGVVS